MTDEVNELAGCCFGDFFAIRESDQFVEKIAIDALAKAPNSDLAVLKMEGVVEDVLYRVEGTTEGSLHVNVGETHDADTTMTVCLSLIELALLSQNACNVVVGRELSEGMYDDSRDLVGEALRVPKQVQDSVCCFLLDGCRQPGRAEIQYSLSSQGRARVVARGIPHTAR